jgi:shikimate kinase
VTEPARIVLVGLMGAGKSSVAKAIADRLGGAVIDTDHVVEETSGFSVSELFAAEGEASFRRRELDALVHALEEPAPVVIATGGGIVTTDAGRAVLRAHRPVVFLDVSIDVAANRVGDGTTRPMLGADPRGSLAELDQARRCLYEEVADVVVDADARSAARVADAVLEAIGGGA